MKLPLNNRSPRPIVAVFFLVALSLHAAQQPPQSTPPLKQTVDITKIPQIPAQIELLETRFRFESSGDSRKEVHARVHINNELGVRQFARLNFDYDRAFQHIEIPLVRITHSSGGTADILPSAIYDNPNPAVISAPAYQDVRVKSVRILGLEPSDTLEYRVITTTAHHPLAPNFWLEHSFDRTGVVSREIFELDIPAAPTPQIRINPVTPANSTDKSGEGSAARVVYRWNREPAPSKSSIDAHSAADEAERSSKPDKSPGKPDVSLTTFLNWQQLAASSPLANLDRLASGATVRSKAAELTRSAPSSQQKLEAIYDFVSQKISTIDLPLGSTGFRLRSAAEILASGYATPEDKFVLLHALAYFATGGESFAVLTAPSESLETEPPLPSRFTQLLVAVKDGSRTFWLDTAVEVAPFGMIASEFRGRPALRLLPSGDGDLWPVVPLDLPFKAEQRVHVDASLSPAGALAAKLKYTLRGDNELLLRVAFHQSPKEKWKDVAQLLALADGFRGKIVSVDASDPYATHEPFHVEYEISQPKFVDWSKNSVRIPAILPLVGLPDPPLKSASSPEASSIDLGTPLDVLATLSLRLPPGVSSEAPVGTSVDRDYATFSSTYSTHDGVLGASRHINFLLRELPASRTADYAAFVHAIQSDQAQFFTLTRPARLAPNPPIPATSR